MYNLIVYNYAIMTSATHSEEFKKNGYLELRAFFSPAEVQSILRSVQNAKQCEKGRDRLNDNGLIFNHNLYFHNPDIQKFVSQQKMIDVIKPLAGPDIWIHWDQLVTKQPGGVEFPWHQDNGYNGLKNEHFQFWIALSDSHPENGGLWLSPGSHKKGIRPHAWVGKHKVYQGEIKGELPIYARAGDAIIFSSLLLHRTKPNTTNVMRYAYVVEYMSTKHYDPHLSAPYFMVAKNGVSRPSFENTYEGEKKLFARFQYPGFFAKRVKHSLRKHLALR